MNKGDLVKNKLTKQVARIISVEGIKLNLYYINETGGFSSEGLIHDFELVESIPKEVPNQSLRLNSGKTQTREIDPNFILGIGEVLTKSRDKYEHFNWQKPTKFSTPYESLMRHLMFWASGEDYDKETGKHHLLHCATNIMFILYHDRTNKEYSDDRGFKK